ncbi:MAG: peptide-methionine (R)-S-oxide reductase MsrB [Weeksellaceae bacterium]
MTQTKLQKKHQLMTIIAAVIVVLLAIFFWMSRPPEVTAPAKSTSVDLEKLSLDEKVKFTDEQWREVLTPQQYEVMRNKGTETPYTGEYLDNKQKGTYVTADCGEPVFHSDQKYDSQTGWPSFWAPIDEDAVELVEDNSYGMKRIEVISKKCKTHLGHVFPDGPKDKTGQRFCINSVALTFIPDEL